MFLSDAWITVFQAAIALAYAGVGVHLTMYPADTRRKRTVYYVVFSVLTVLTLGLVYVQVKRSEESQKRSELIQTENTNRLKRANAEIAELRKELPKQIALSGSDITGATRSLGTAPPSAADKATRKALRNSLGRFLLRGDTQRQALRDWTSEATGDDESMRELKRQLTATEKWDKELVAFVRTNLGPERAVWLRARVPVEAYPAGPWLRDAERAWGTIGSNMTKIDQLLRDYPEL